MHCHIHACKKQEIQSERSVDKATAIKTAVQRFNETFSKTASQVERAKVAALFQKIEYGNAAIVSIGDTSTLYIIRISENVSSKGEKFVGILQHQDNYTFDGIYEAENIDAINSVFTLKSLPINDSVFVRGLNNYPTKEWVSDGSGALHYRENRSSSIKDIEKLKKALSQFSSVKTDNVHEGTPCIAWYWWEYYDCCGWMPITFLYTTGCDEGGGGGGYGGDPEPPEDPFECNFTAIQADSMLNGTTATGLNEVTYSEGIPITDEWGVVRVARNTTWKFLSVNQSASYEPVFSAIFTGMVHIEYPLSTWRWGQFVYSQVMQTSGRTKPCTTVDCVASASTVISADSTKASVSLTYSSKQTIVCPINAQWRDVKSSTIYNEFVAH
jgi:hypothetical protein